MRAALLHGEDAALDADLAAPMAGCADFHLAVFRAAAVAGFALDQRGDLDAPLDAGDGFFQIQFQHVADVGTTSRSARTGGATAKNIAEDIAKDISHVRTTRPATAAAHAVLERRMAVRVVGTALVAVRQHFIGFLAFLERCLCSSVARIAVRVVLHGTTPISLLQLLVAGATGHAQNFVVIAFAHDRESGIGRRESFKAYILTSVGIRKGQNSEGAMP